MTYNAESSNYSEYPYLFRGGPGATWISTITAAEAYNYLNGKIGVASYLTWIKGTGAKVTFKNKLKDGVKLYLTGFLITTGKIDASGRTTSISNKEYDITDSSGTMTITANNGTTVKVTGTAEAVRVPTQTGSLQAFPENDVSALYTEPPTTRQAWLLDDGITIECNFADGDNYFVLNNLYILTNHYSLGQEYWSYKASHYCGTLDGKYYMTVKKYESTTGNE